MGAPGASATRVADSATREADVAIVGAGLAGLAAAREIKAQGKTACVLEARDRVGGRTLNEPIGDGKIVEIGGQWVGPTQHRVNALITELGLETYPTFTEGRNIFERAGSLRQYSGTIPRVSPLALAETGMTLARIDRMAKRVDTERPWAGDDAERWDSMTFATWINRNVRTPTARDLIRLAIWAVWAVEPEDLSLLHVLFYIHSAGSFNDLLDTQGGAQDSRVVGGTQLISLRMAEQLGDAIELNAPVRRIEHSVKGSDPLTTVVADRVTVRARKVIVAVPPFLAGRIDYEPAMPAVRDGLTQRMSQGSVVKCMAIYDRPFWRDRGLSGQATSATGPISVTYDNSPPDGSPGVLLGFFEAGAARHATELSQDERRRLALDCMRRFFGPEASDPVHYVDKAWAADPWSRGCYGGFMPTGAWTATGSALRPPVGPIHWAGAETATVWNGYMDGAVSSGQRAAAEVLEAIGS